MSRQRAHLLLLLAALFWGLGNLPQKTVLDHVGPLTAAGGRCVIAMLVIIPLAILEDRSSLSPRSGFLRSSLGVAVLFTLAIGVQQAAFGYTTVTNAGFLVNSCTVMVPFIVWVTSSQRPGWAILLAGVATCLGAFFLSGATVTGLPNSGDLACVLSAAFYAAWMVALGRHATVHDRPMGTALAQFAVASAIFVPAAINAEEISASGLSDAAQELLILGLMSTAAAFVLQTMAQRYTSASTAAVIVSGESVFGALAAAIVLGEHLDMGGVVGATLILASILSVALIRQQQAAVV